ncbi:DUF7310 family coiled-coil domain-containing protein [Halorarum salinum]|uniref:DUF7310 domain-containing protein n=1 Tax=Halorarum salinum TaxID=2743089 RepID=A0A7D5QD46_9EURY|nr:hypothetical protein [Halobaculum salinum]QLG63000.1 hypothetical protein HUG12_15170 [Halobaculum salinum]
MSEPTEGETNRSRNATDPGRRARGGTGGNVDPAALAARLSAVERALADDGCTPTAGGAHASVGGSDAADLDRRLSAVEDSLADLEDRLADLEGATEALRGYVGGVRAVDRDVERRADAALAAVDRLEADAAPGVPTGSEGNSDAAPGLESESESEAHHGSELRSGAAPERDSDSADQSAPDGVASRLRDAL